MPQASLKMKYLGSKFSDSQYGTGTWSTGDIKTISAAQAVSIEGDATLAPNFIPYDDSLDNVQVGALQRPYVLDMGAIPWGIANSGTVATNGTYTAGTAYNTTYSGGIWLYFPATAFATAAAGWYWCVASSTTAFQVYTSQAATTLITGSNAGFTGDTTQRTAVTVTVPANSMGKNGTIRNYIGGSCNSTAGVKSIQSFIGASGHSLASASTNTAINGQFFFQNRNSTSSQRLTSYLSSTNAGTYATIDTTADQAFTLRLQIATATDVLVLENWLVELIPQG